MSAILWPLFGIYVAKVPKDDDSITTHPSAYCKAITK